MFITYSCVFCKQLLETIEAGRQDGQVGKQVYVRHLVPPDADGYSTIAALALECGALQNRATVVHESLLSGDRFETREGLIQALQGVRGLDLGAMETCLADSGLRSSFAIDFEDAVSLAVDGTPTSFYENRSVRGALDLKLVLELIRGES